MKYEGIIEGYFVDIRSIELEDVEFSYNIRRSQFATDFVGQQAQSIKEQEKYIAMQISKPNDYYFVVQSKTGRKIGLYGIYDIEEDTGEFGREVCIGNSIQAMEVEMLMLKFANDYLRLKNAYYVIYSDNIKQINNQKKFGIHPIGECIRSGRLCYEYLENIELMLEKKKIVNSYITKLKDNNSFKE